MPLTSSEFRLKPVVATLPSFLDALFSTGRVRVSAEEPVSEEELRQAEALLASAERQTRLELPGEPPPFHAPAARWAAMMLYQACPFAVFRELAEQEIRRALTVPCPAGNEPSRHYSVDLTFRYLPDLLRHARTASQEDPLVDQLLAWAAAWPLSSVGIAGVGPVEVSGFAEHPGLLRLYVDRILASRDLDRLSDPRVREAARGALGLFPELAAEVAAALSERSQENREQDDHERSS